MENDILYQNHWATFTWVCNWEGNWVCKTQLQRQSHLVHYPHGEVLKMTLKKAIRISLKKWNEPKLCYCLPHAPKNLLNMKINHTYLLPCMIFSRDFWESNKPSLRLTKELSKIIFIIIIRYLFFLKTLQMKRSSKRHLAFFLIRYLNHRNNQLLYQ